MPIATPNFFPPSSFASFTRSHSHQVVVFRDIDYSELVRVEMRGIRKLGDNPVLASVEFEVCSV